jgi:hypothetical protein
MSIATEEMKSRNMPASTDLHGKGRSEMREQIRKALMEFGPCSVRELHDYLRSDLALKRGLFCSKDTSMELLRAELNALAEENKTIIKFMCKTGTKVRYGITLFPGDRASETRYLVPMGTLQTCVYCALPIFTCENRRFHFPAKCTEYKTQNYFKIFRYKDTRAIISDDFVYGVIDNTEPFTLRLTKEVHLDKANRVLSELWYINQQACQQQQIPAGRLLPLKTRETMVE